MSSRHWLNFLYENKFQCINKYKQSYFWVYIIQLTNVKAEGRHNKIYKNGTKHPLEVFLFFFIFFFIFVYKIKCVAWIINRISCLNQKSSGKHWELFFVWDIFNDLHSIMISEVYKYYIINIFDSSEAKIWNLIKRAVIWIQSENGCVVCLTLLFAYMPITPKMSSLAVNNFCI